MAKDLTKLKAALYGTSALDLPMDFCRQNLLHLAKQHVDPDELTKMYGTLCLGSKLDQRCFVALMP